MTNLFEIVETTSWKKRLPLIVGAALLLAVGLVWYFGWFGGSPAVDDKVREIRGAAQTSERRADAVLSGVKSKEVLAREAVRKKISDLPDDAVCDALATLLAQFRREK